MITESESDKLIKHIFEINGISYEPNAPNAADSTKPFGNNPENQLLNDVATKTKELSESLFCEKNMYEHNDICDRINVGYAIINQQIEKDFDKAISILRQNNLKF